jgi:hypothetical protein
MASIRRRLEHGDVFLASRGDTGEVRNREQFFATVRRAIIHFTKQELRAQNLPVIRYIAEPWDARGFEWDRGIKTACDGAMDDHVLLFMEQIDYLSLCSNRPIQPSVRPVQEPHDRSLLNDRRKNYCDFLQLLAINVLNGCSPTHRTFLDDCRRAIRCITQEWSMHVNTWAE